MARRIELTVTEILDALQVARHDIGPAYALTVAEMAEKTGLHRHVVTTQLKRAKAEGRLHTYRVKRERLDGVMRASPAYVIAAPPKQKRA